jgi:hypothetical protein
MKGTKTMMKQATQEINQKGVQFVEHLFVASLHGDDVLFVKAVGRNPEAYRLPDGFLRRLEEARKPKPLFSLGRTFITPGASAALEESGQTAAEFLSMHERGEWGLVGKDDAKENDLSVREGFRILSAYKTIKGEKLWIITEHDRSASTVMLPSDY